MKELGIILIGTGLIVFFSGRAMIQATKKMIKKSRFYNDVEDLSEQDRVATKTEEEFTQMVKRSMTIFYIVGITCILLGIILIIFS